MLVFTGTPDGVDWPAGLHDSWQPGQQLVSRIEGLGEMLSTPFRSRADARPRPATGLQQRLTASFQKHK